DRRATETSPFRGSVGGRGLDLVPLFSKPANPWNRFQRVMKGAKADRTEMSEVYTIAQQGNWTQFLARARRMKIDEDQARRAYDEAFPQPFSQSAPSQLPAAWPPLPGAAASSKPPATADVEQPLQPEALAVTGPPAGHGAEDDLPPMPWRLLIPVEQPPRSGDSNHMSPIRPETPRESRPDDDSAYNVLPVTVDDGDEVMPVEGWQDTEVEVALDSGCCNHVMDAEDAPGYTIRESPGSRRGQNFVVGNGQRIPNEGQVRLNMEAPSGDGTQTPVQSTFQIAEVSRPLMSVSKICEQGYACLFTKDGAQILDQEQKTIARFKCANGLYVASMKLKQPEPFTRQAP
ncbi:MAG: hypothetical protein OSB14_11675, partial [Planctomycetota bacterium]|nr:hypothetical protein [Planctomycetota bacterium]